MLTRLSLICSLGLMLAASAACTAIFPFDQELPVADGDADGDGDADSDGDGDADSDGDGDADSDGDVEGDTETDSDAESDEDADGEVDPCDQDRDGYLSEDCDGDDCNDEDPDIHPGAVEICNDVNDDCDEYLDETENLLVHSASVNSLTPSMIHVDGNLAVVWVASSNFPTLEGASGEVFFAQIAESGDIVEGPHQVTDSGNRATNPTLAPSSMGYGIVYTRITRDSAADLRYIKLNGRGEVEGEETTLVSGVSTPNRPALVWNGSHFGVAWENNQRLLASINFALVTENGTIDGEVLKLNDPPVAAQTRRVEMPAVAWNGSEFGVAWSDRREGPARADIFFARVTIEGTVLGERPIAGGPGGHDLHPSLVAAGDAWGLAFTRQTVFIYFQIFFATLHPNGTLWNGPFEIGENETVNNRSSLSCNGEQFGLAWRTGAANAGDVMVVLLSATGGSLSREYQVTTVGGESAAPSLVWDGEFFDVIWHDDREGEWFDLYFAPDLCLL